jgi:lipoate-protein ligase A
LWRERSRWTVEEFMDKLVEFMQQHPHPSVERPPVEEVKEEDFECIAWVYLV